jgi:predicted aspartyl protease
MNKKHDDGLEWLRELRRNLAAQCGNDLHATGEFYRAAAARGPHRVFRDNSSVKRVKRKKSCAWLNMNSRVGMFYTSCRVENHNDRKKSAEVPEMLVDAGAEFTWINAATLKNIGVKHEKKDYTFVMANGQQITRPVGFAIIHVGDAVTIDEVIFGEPGDLEILGARTLEGMNLRIDPRVKKLVAGGPILAA